MTTSTRAEAENITEHLLSERLVACCNIVGPISSAYAWKGKIEKADEFLVFMKTSQDLFERLSARIKELHSYDIPEVIAVPIIAGLPSYLDWISTVIRPEE